MRAGRLVSLLLLLQERGRCTAAELAEQLEVSQRTILRDIDELSGAGVPVYAVRGPGGGFQLLDGFRAELPVPAAATAVDRRAGRGRRARVWITPEGRRLAVVLQVLQPLRLARNRPADAEGRLEATFRLRSLEQAVVEVLALGAQVEVVEPAELRRAVASELRNAARRYRATGGGRDAGAVPDSGA